MLARLQQGLLLSHHLLVEQLLLVHGHLGDPWIDVREMHLLCLPIALSLAHLRLHKCYLVLHEEALALLVFRLLVRLL